jgi:hypothetical protein
MEALAATILIPASVNLTILDSSSKRDRALFVLAYFF